MNNLNIVNITKYINVNIKCYVNTGINQQVLPISITQN